ncbi:MAG: hypothetical protein EOP53_24305 [Sphingobacteriales bacterium]|nr:MAG: hypothetical protein EOP53_24305 [Sphingobacteriales bacterium]
MTNETHSVKKCPSCQEYSAWDGKIDSTCEFCGQVLDPRTLRETRLIEEKNKQAQLKFEHPVFWVSIKPGDKPLTVFGKRIITFAQIIYMAVISFLLWVTAIVAG